MASESQENNENENNESREEHIKQRLKELGVSEDSERPKQSFVSKYGKYFLAGIIVALVVAYWFEYNQQESDERQMTADAATGGRNAMQYPGMPYSYGQPMEPPAWVKERRAKMQQPPEPPEWVKQRRAQMQQHREWMQKQMEMYNPAMNNRGENTDGNNDPQANAYPYYAQPYPYPRWQGYPGYYNNGYAPWYNYGGDYAGGYPYYNGW